MFSAADTAGALGELNKKAEIRLLIFLQILIP